MSLQAAELAMTGTGIWKRRTYGSLIEEFDRYTDCARHLDKAVNVLFRND